MVQYAMAGIGVPHARADKQILPIERLRDRMSRLQALLAHSDKGGHGTKLGRRQVGLRAILPCCLTHRHLTLSHIGTLLSLGPAAAVGCLLSLMLLVTLRLTGVVMHRTSIKQPTEQARTQILYKMKHEEITEMRRSSMIRAARF